MFGHKRDKVVSNFGILHDKTVDDLYMSQSIARGVKWNYDRQDM